MNKSRSVWAARMGRSDTFMILDKQICMICTHAFEICLYAGFLVLLVEFFAPVIVCCVWCYFLPKTIQSDTPQLCRCDLWWYLEHETQMQVCQGCILGSSACLCVLRWRWTDCGARQSCPRMCYPSTWSYFFPSIL